MRETTKSPNFAGQTDNRDAIATHYSDFHTLSQRVMDHARFIRIRRN
jgi:hypothetical protein